jgi:putative ABC transport system permease protein
MTFLFRVAVRVCLAGRPQHQQDEIVETAARLAADARRRGRLGVVRYWIREFRTLFAVAYAAPDVPQGVHYIEPVTRRVGLMLPSLLQDVRYSLRLLWRTPGTTAIALLTLALGIGASTAIFSVIDGVLLRPLRYPDPDRLYLVLHRRAETLDAFLETTPGNFYDVTQAAQTFSHLAAYDGANETLTGKGDPERLQGIRSAGSVLAVLGVEPQLGRIYTDDDDRIGAARTVVISDRLWRRLFDARSDAIGESVTLNGLPHTVIGVMPVHFRFPETAVDFWAPGQMSANLRTSRTEYFLSIIGRLREGVAPETAHAELDTIMRRLQREHPEPNGGLAFAARPLQEALVTDVSRLLWILMGSVGCVLLIACANLANLILARATGRRQEMAVRQAIGARRGRLVRQLLVESVVLALGGGIAGVLVGFVFLDALVAWLPPGIPRIEETAVDARVMVVTFVVAAMTGILFGLAPALQMAARSPASILRDNARTSTGRSPLRSMLVVVEIALALVLLAGAGLLVRSFILMQRVDPGFTTENLLTFQVGMQGPTYSRNEARVAFVSRLVQRLQTLPGVQQAAAGSTVPIAGRGTGAWFNILARPVPAGTTPPSVPYRVITPEYFRALQIPLVRGRVLTERDTAQGTPSVVISESVAKRFWPTPADGDPIGAEIYLGAPDNRLFERATIVGIAKDVKLAGLATDLTEVVYGVHGLMPFWRGFTFIARTSGDPMALASVARQVVREADPALAVTNIQTVSRILERSAAPARASMLLLTLFAAVAVVMAAIGVFGVMSYAVNLRLREMGIRMALGADPGDVRRLVIVHGLKHALVGVTLGLAGAALVTRWMTTLLFGVKPDDPLTLAAAAGLLLLTAAAACYIPARRATRTDPLLVLRVE